MPATTPPCQRRSSGPVSSVIGSEAQTAATEWDPLTFFDVMPRFRDGSDTPRAYLERCLAVIADREPVVKAWVVLNPSGAREAADASTERYRRGRSISSIDGMPIGIKDLIETKDMPTGHGCAAFAGNHTRRDSARGRSRSIKLTHISSRVRS